MTRVKHDSINNEYPTTFTLLQTIKSKHCIKELQRNVTVQPIKLKLTIGLCGRRKSDDMAFVPP